jgi:hypothetical protein
MGRSDHEYNSALGLDPGLYQPERSKQLNSRGQHVQFGISTDLEEAECSASSFDEGASTSDKDLVSPDNSSRHPRYHQLDRARSQALLNISISRAQTHLTSPTTPATEKTAALQASEGYFGTIHGTLHSLSLASGDVSPTGSELSLNASNEDDLRESLTSGDGTEVSIDTTISCIREPFDSLSGFTGQCRTSQKGTSNVRSGSGRDGISH